MQTTASSGNKVTDFQKKTNKTYVRKGVFGPYTGPSENAIIQTNQNIRKKSIPLIGELSGAGVRGSSQLVGNEEALSNYDFTFEPTHIRNGVLIDNEENEKTDFTGIFGAGTNDFITKPISEEVLVERIINLINIKRQNEALQG